jgi:hypothetical protein
MKIISLIGGGLLILLAFYYFSTLNSENEPVSESDQAIESKQVENLNPEMQNYEDIDTKLSFDYRTSPEGYTLIELEKSENSSDYFVSGVRLFRTTDYEEMQSDLHRGAPPSFIISIFDNSELEFYEWLAANTLLTNDQGTQETIMVGRASGVMYAWEGMFSGETAVVQNGDYIYMFEGLYNTDTDDARRQDFKDLLQSVSFD